MKKTIFFVLATVALGSSADVCAAADASRVLATVSCYGDFMGTAPDDQITSQKVYLYNQDLQVVAVVETACGQRSKELYTQYYSPYVYDESGRLVMIDHYQYGLYDYGDRVMHRAAGVVEYRYDEQGNVVEQIENQNSIVYEYDAEGNCTKEIHYIDGSAGKTLIYSDFSAGKNLPALVESSHSNQTFTGEFYEEEREYSESGKLLKAVRLCNRDYVEDYGLWQITTAAGDFMQEEHWTYEGDQLMLYEKFNSLNEETGELIPYIKTVYTVKDDHTIGFQSYSAFGRDWYKSGVYQEETYYDFTGKLDETALQLVDVRKVGTGMNDAELEWTVPAICASDATVSYNIYRNGELIQNLKQNEASLSGEGDFIINASGNLVYADRNIISGEYDYMVQTVIDDEEGHGYCVSNILKADLKLEFPAVTNIRAVESVKDNNNYNVVTVLFAVPANAADLGFVSNELILGNNQVGEDVRYNPEENTMHCTISDDKAVVSILSRYQLGKVLSERVEIDVNNLSSLEQVRALDEKVKIFDLNGTLVSAPIEQLHGTFILVGEKKAYKVIL